MEMLKMMKDAMAMRAKLSEMERALKAKVLEVETGGVTVTVNAKGDVLGLRLGEDTLGLGREKAEARILAAVQAAAKKAQEVMGEEAKKLTGGMHIPGLM